MQNRTFEYKIALKNGQILTARFPQIEDVISLTNYINNISKEDLYIGLSGEKYTAQEQKSLLEKVIMEIKNGNSVWLLAFFEGRVVGICNLDRNFRNLRRTDHRAVLGLTVDKQFRELGLGRQLLELILKLHSQYMPNIKIIELNVFSENLPAIALYKKLGFQEYGRLNSGFSYRGKYVDDVYMYLNV